MSEARRAAEAPTRCRPARNTLTTVIAAMTTDGSLTLTSSTRPHSRERDAGGDPIEERGLLRHHLVVEERQQPVAVLRHLPHDAGVVGLVFATDVRRAQSEAAHEQREGEKHERYDQWPTIDYARGSGRSTVEPDATRKGVRRWIARVGPAAERSLCSGARCELRKVLRDPLHRRALCRAQFACREPSRSIPSLRCDLVESFAWRCDPPPQVSFGGLKEIEARWPRDGVARSRKFSAQDLPSNDLHGEKITRKPASFRNISSSTRGHATCSVFSGAFSAQGGFV
jgi:hypothetical protein